MANQIEAFSIDHKFCQAEIELITKLHGENAVIHAGIGGMQFLGGCTAPCCTFQELSILFWSKKDTKSKVRTPYHRTLHISHWKHKISEETNDTFESWDTYPYLNDVTDFRACERIKELQYYKDVEKWSLQEDSSYEAITSKAVISM